MEPLTVASPRSVLIIVVHIATSSRQWTCRRDLLGNSCKVAERTRMVIPSLLGRLQFRNLTYRLVLEISAGHARNFRRAPGGSTALLRGSTSR